MHHDVFGEIAYNEDELAWAGSCPLPVFAEYGRLAPDDYRLSEPAPEFGRGVFALAVQDDAGDGPSVEQANVFRFLLEREHEVCRAVMTALINACAMRGGLLRWLNERRESRLWGWLARLVGPEYKAPEDLKQAARCRGLEIASRHDGGYAYIAFYFETVFGIEVEHGLSVIFHPEKGTFWGDASAIHYML
jgi:hypothetical protein